MTVNALDIVELAPDATVGFDETATCSECGMRFEGRYPKQKLAVHARKHSKKEESKDKATTPKPPRTPPTPPTTRRKSASSLLETIWGALPHIVGAQSPAMARALAFEAPAAGMILDRACAGTVIDRMLLQPAVRAEDKWAPVMSLAILPILLGAVEKAPHLAPALIVPIRSSVRDLLEASLDRQAEQQAEGERLAAKAAKLGYTEEQVTNIIDVTVATLLGEEPTETVN